MEIAERTLSEIQIQSALFMPSIQVIRRNGQLSPFDANKIILATTKAFLAIEGEPANYSKRIHEKTHALASNILEKIKRKMPAGDGTIHIEDIQDWVEIELMRAGDYEVAKEYILYRKEREREREASMKQHQPTNLGLKITARDGSEIFISDEQLNQMILHACEGLSGVGSEVILQEAKRNLFEGAPESEINKALIMASRTLIEKEPNYSFVTAKLLLNELQFEAYHFLGLETKTLQGESPTYFKAYLEKGVQLELLHPDLLKFDLTQICAAIKPERSKDMTYLGLQTLYDRYFIHSNGKRFELPQAFFMRVAMGLSLNEPNKEQSAIQFYDLLSTFDYMSSTPTLFNSGTLRPQLSSCYLTTVPDDLDGIYGAIKDNALLSKYAGGLGNDWTKVRALGAQIKGTNGKSQGVVPFMYVANATAIAVNQGGKRKGAVCGYLETWHKDIEEFLELRKNTGDDRRRTHDMNTANWIPDLFMERVIQEGEWTLFSPDEVPDLHETYGDMFREKYISYEQKAARGEINNYKKIPAISLWRKMLSMIFETGHPWITFKDPCNLRSPQQHIGVVHSSNLCTEITLNTSQEEIAVCNLGSINLPAHFDGKKLNLIKLRQTVHTAIRMLDNVIDINYYSVPEARHSNLRHRPIGLGIMGFQDALYILRTPYSSDAAVEFADRTMEAISYFAIEASSLLAQERGTYETYRGSLWSQGILPIDSIEILKKNRHGQLEQNTDQTLDWKSLRERVKQYGMRNSNVLAIAPTATISNICGVSQSIEPTYQNLFVKSNLSGEFTVINPYLVNELKALNLWDEVMVNDLKYYNGSVSAIDRIPQSIRELYATAFEIEPTWLIEAASRRQKWIDQAQSLNLYLSKPSGKKLDQTYKFAWLRGLKTTYYLRTLGATHTEKSTVDDRALNAVPTEPKVCLINDPTCEACQ